jgi:hypothetical protein
MDVAAVAGGDVIIASELFNVDPLEIYKPFAWVGGVLLPDTEISMDFYNTDNDLLESNPVLFTNLTDNQWAGIWTGGYAPTDAVYGQMRLTFKSMAADESVSITRPSVMPNSNVISDFMYWMLPNVPDYIVEADFAQAFDGVGVPTPLMRYLALGTGQLHDAMDTVTSWDFTPHTETADGFPDTSSLVDPFKTDAAWLEWLAQLMGVSLDTIPAGGRSPWLAFEGGGIDTWTEWEEDVDPGSIPGIPDTEWVDIETYSPDFYDTESARRLQIASGFNGVLGGTSESIIRYVGALLNTDDPDPFVYVTKHYGTNPYRILVSMLDIEDPDPKGDMIELAVEAATPAGTNVTTAHGVSSTARTHFTIPNMFYNMWIDIENGGSQFPMRLVENSSGNGKHITLTSNTLGDAEPFYGGEIALARWFEGFAMYSGASRIRSDTHASFNLLGDLDLRILVSNVTVPASGKTLELMSSQDKWSLSVNDAGFLVFSWENSGTNTITSDASPDWGSIDKGPYWLRVTLDLNNDAGGHDVAFYQSPTLYEDSWPPVGTTITTGGVSGIDTAAAANIEIFNNGTAPEDGATGIAYRVMLLDGIEGSIAYTLNLTGEFSFGSNDPNTGTSLFNMPVSNIRMYVEPAAIGATNLAEARWTAQNHGGFDDYFYLGVSPFKDDGGNPAFTGDNIVVSDLASDTYDWEITLVGGAKVNGSTGTVTEITWDADDYGGLSIVNIIVREDTGDTVQAFFTADLFDGLLESNADTYSKTWTLTRAWTTANYYEYSSFNKRDSISVTEADGVFVSGITFDADETVTVAVAARRFWSGSGTTVIVDHTTTSGWKLEYIGDDIVATITDGTSPITLTYDEVVGATLGVFSLITLRRDVANATISLFINSIEEDTIADPFLTGGLFATVGDTGVFGDSAAVNKFDFRYFGVFDRALSDRDIALLSDEMSRLTQVLPQATKTINASYMPPTTIIYTPGFDITWYMAPPLLASGTTIHAPQVNKVVLVDYLPTGIVLHSPQLNMYVPMDALALTQTFHDFTSTNDP